MKFACQKTRVLGLSVVGDLSC